MITKCILLFFVIVVCVDIGESSHCTMNTSTNECMCPTGYKNNNGTCEAECTYPCGKGICYKPNMCRCFDGYKINIRRLRQLTDKKLPLCTPSCKNCTGECVAPNTCIVTTTVVPATTTSKAPPTTSTILPTTITPSTAEPTVITTTVVTPSTTVTPATIVPVAIITTTTLTPLTSTSNVTNSTTAVPVTTVTPITTSTVSLTTPISTTSLSSTGYEEESTTELPTSFIYDFGHETTTDHIVAAQTLDPSLLERKAAKQTWMTQDWLFLIISLIIATAIILLLVWRRKPIVRFFKGRSYVLEDDRPGRNGVQYSRTAQNDESKDAYC